jgi:RNA polymerase sigma-70 factor (ECF subfamily)
MSEDRTSRDAIGESLLVLRCQVGSEQAFEALFERYNARLRYYLRRMLGEGGQAEDVLQNVWITVLHKISTLREPRAFRSWLYRIARNRAVGELRKAGRELPMEETPEAAATGGNDDLPLRDPEAVHRALERVSAAHREVITLRFLNGLAYEEIARVIGCSIGTVRSRIHYAKRAMRQEMEENHE